MGGSRAQWQFPALNKHVAQRYWQLLSSDWRDFIKGLHIVSTGDNGAIHAEDSASTLLTDYILPGINGVRAALIFLRQGSVAGLPSASLKDKKTGRNLQTAMCSPQGKLHEAITAAFPTIKQWLNEFPCGYIAIWNGGAKKDTGFTRLSWNWLCYPACVHCLLQKQTF